MGNFWISIAIIFFVGLWNNSGHIQAARLTEIYINGFGFDGQPIVRPSSRYRSSYPKSFTYPAYTVVAYPPGTGLIYDSGTNVNYPAGASLKYLNPSNVSVKFPTDTMLFMEKGPVKVSGGEVFNFSRGSEVSFGPGTRLEYLSNAVEVNYGQFYGNSHAIVEYIQTTPTFYYLGTSDDIILYDPSTNPLVYYNPGGFTQFGPSPMPPDVELIDPKKASYKKDPNKRGLTYLSGYSYNGWPQTTYIDFARGEKVICDQTCPNCWTYTRVNEEEDSMNEEAEESNPEKDESTNNRKLTREEIANICKSMPEEVTDANDNLPKAIPEKLETDDETKNPQELEDSKSDEMQDLPDDENPSTNSEDGSSSLQNLEPPVTEEVLEIIVPQGTPADTTNENDRPILDDISSSSSQEMDDVSDMPTTTATEATTRGKMEGIGADES